MSMYLRVTAGYVAATVMDQIDKLLVVFGVDPASIEEGGSKEAGEVQHWDEPEERSQVDNPQINKLLRTIQSRLPSVSREFDKALIGDLQGKFQTGLHLTDMTPGEIDRLHKGELKNDRIDTTDLEKKHEDEEDPEKKQQLADQLTDMNAAKDSSKGHTWGHHGTFGMYVYNILLQKITKVGTANFFFDCVGYIRLIWDTWVGGVAQGGGGSGGHEEGGQSTVTTFPIQKGDPNFALFGTKMGTEKVRFTGKVVREIPGRPRVYEMEFDGAPVTKAKYDVDASGSNLDLMPGVDYRMEFLSSSGKNVRFKIEGGQLIQSHPQISSMEVGKLIVNGVNGWLRVHGKTLQSHAGRVQDEHKKMGDSLAKLKEDLQRYHDGWTGEVVHDDKVPEMKDGKPTGKMVKRKGQVEHLPYDELEPAIAMENAPDLKKELQKELQKRTSDIARAKKQIQKLERTMHGLGEAIADFTDSGSKIHEHMIEPQFNDPLFQQYKEHDPALRWVNRKPPTKAVPMGKLPPGTTIEQPKKTPYVSQGVGDQGVSDAPLEFGEKQVAEIKKNLQEATFGKQPVGGIPMDKLIGMYLQAINETPNVNTSNFKHLFGNLVQEYLERHDMPEKSRDLFNKQLQDKDESLYSQIRDAILSKEEFSHARDNLVRAKRRKLMDMIRKAFNAPEDIKKEIHEAWRNGSPDFGKLSQIYERVMTEGRSELDMAMEELARLERSKPTKKDTPLVTLEDGSRIRPDMDSNPEWQKKVDEARKKVDELNEKRAPKEVPPAKRRSKEWIKNEIARWQGIIDSSKDTTREPGLPASRVDVKWLTRLQAMIAKLEETPGPEYAAKAEAFKKFLIEKSTREMDRLNRMLGQSESAEMVNSAHSHTKLLEHLQKKNPGHQEIDDALSIHKQQADALHFEHLLTEVSNDLHEKMREISKAQRALDQASTPEEKAQIQAQIYGLNLERDRLSLKQRYELERLENLKFQDGWIEKHKALLGKKEWTVGGREVPGKELLPHLSHKGKQDIAKAEGKEEASRKEEELSKERSNLDLFTKKLKDAQAAGAPEQEIAKLQRKVVEQHSIIRDKELNLKLDSTDLGLVKVRDNIKYEIEKNRLETLISGLEHALKRAPAASADAKKMRADLEKAQKELVQLEDEESPGSIRPKKVAVITRHPYVPPKNVPNPSRAWDPGFINRGLQEALDELHQLENSKPTSEKDLAEWQKKYDAAEKKVEEQRKDFVPGPPSRRAEPHIPASEVAEVTELRDFFKSLYDASYKLEKTPGSTNEVKNLLVHTPMSTPRPSREKRIEDAKSHLEDLRAQLQEVEHYGPEKVPAAPHKEPTAWEPKEFLRLVQEPTLLGLQTTVERNMKDGFEALSKLVSQFEKFPRYQEFIAAMKKTFLSHLLSPHVPVNDEFVKAYAEYSQKWPADKDPGVITMRTHITQRLSEFVDEDPMGLDITRRPGDPSKKKKTRGDPKVPSGKTDSDLIVEKVHPDSKKLSDRLQDLLKAA